MLITFTSLNMPAATSTSFSTSRARIVFIDLPPPLGPWKARRDIPGASGHSSIALIVGIVLGVLAFSSIGVVGLYCFLRRRRPHKQNAVYDFKLGRNSGQLGNLYHRRMKRLERSQRPSPPWAPPCAGDVEKCLSETLPPHRPFLPTMSPVAVNPSFFVQRPLDERGRCSSMKVGRESIRESIDMTAASLRASICHATVMSLSTGAPSLTNITVDAVKIALPPSPAPPDRL
ncbi:hypothetical protein CC80DRAFT_567632 [Byssothecium circinans]|uniref:Uncharacterized protein n=1 Tax=Byssothecium circinans TaxID=147558 RepID=A0A6A5TP17_9PLEO|nr:hypothetical protein CC80DRAFT_567632 [Byssothecium circinans]